MRPKAGGLSDKANQYAHAPLWQKAPFQHLQRPQEARALNKFVAMKFSDISISLAFTLLSLLPNF